MPSGRSNCRCCGITPTRSRTCCAKGGSRTSTPFEVAVRLLHVAAQLLALFRAAARPHAALFALFAPALAGFVARHGAASHLLAQTLGGCSRPPPARGRGAGAG